MSDLKYKISSFLPFFLSKSTCVQSPFMSCKDEFRYEILNFENKTSFFRGFGYWYIQKFSENQYSTWQKVTLTEQCMSEIYFKDPRGISLQSRHIF